MVALVQQVVGGLPIALRPRNFFIDFGDAAGNGVDRSDFLFEFFVYAGLQFIQLQCGAAQAGGRFADPCQGHGARRQVGWCAGDIRKCVEHVRDCSTQCISTTRKQVLQLIELVGAGGVAGTHCAGQGGLRVQEGAVVALDGRDLNPFADVSCAGVLAVVGLKYRVLS